MDASIISGLSAVLGSLVGGTASIATAWMTQKSQSRRERALDEVHKRERLYAEFIEECSKLSIDSLERTLESPAVLVQVYALQNRIRLTSSVVVVESTDVVINRIVDQYFRPNVTMIELRASHQKDGTPNSDPIKPFSEACRLELQELLSGL